MAGLLILALGWLAGSRRESGANPTSSRLTIYEPGYGIVSSGLQRVIDISQDGETVVFAATGPEGEDLRLRRIPGTGGDRSTAIQTSEFSRQPRFSPDGRFIYSPHGSGTMQRKPIAGGGWTPLPGTDPAPYFTFASDGTIWWSPPIAHSIHRIVPDGRSEPVFQPDSAGSGFTIQQILPGDRTALVLHTVGTANDALPALLDLTTGKAEPVLDEPVVEVRYTAGYLVFVRADNTMLAVRFDPASGRTSGEAVVIATDVAQTGGGTVQFAVAPTGTVIYVPATPAELVIVTKAGTVTPLMDLRGQYHGPSFSPDGRRIAFDYVGEEGRDVWIFDRDQRQLTRTTFDRDGHDPIWATDGRSLYYTSLRRGRFGIYRITPGDSRVDSVFVSSQLSYTGNPLPDGSLVSLASDLRPAAPVTS